MSTKAVALRPGASASVTSTLRRIVRAVGLRTPFAPFRRFRRAARPQGHPDLVRIGSDYGGWTVPDKLVRADWICYSGGVGDDVTFDLGFIERYGCTVHAFDPTPSSIEHARQAAGHVPQFRFHPWGLWSDDRTVRFYEPDWGDSNFSAVNLHETKQYFEAPCRSLTSIMGELGHDHIDLLKLDIEGAEYEVLPAVTAGSLRPTVLCVEFHKKDGVRRVIKTVRQVKERGYDVVTVDGYDVTFVAR